MPDMRSRPVAVAADHPAFAGHFPGQPLLPGVVLLAEVLEVLLRRRAAALGPQPRVSAVKFLAPVRPGAALEVRWSPASRACASRSGATPKATRRRPAGRQRAGGSRRAPRDGRPRARPARRPGPRRPSAATRGTLRLMRWIATTLGGRVSRAGAAPDLAVLPAVRRCRARAARPTTSSACWAARRAGASATGTSTTSPPPSWTASTCCGSEFDRFDVEVARRRAPRRGARSRPRRLPGRRAPGQLRGLARARRRRAAGCAWRC